MLCGVTMIRTVTPRRAAAWARRAFHVSAPHAKTAAPASDSLREDLRALLQHTAQPVSVLTLKSATENSSELYHGATLSSFSSISFYPFPVISFALQLPSRSADALQLHFAQSSSSSHPAVHEKSPEAHLVINILSASQADTALRFSRPDLYPKPFLDVDSTSSSVPKSGSTNIPYYSLTTEGIPKLSDSLGALSCMLLASLPLNASVDSHRLARALEDHTLPSRDEVRPGSASSMLYLARVVRVEDVGNPEAEVDTARNVGRREVDSDWPLPLLYHRKAYGSVKPLHGSS